MSIQKEKINEYLNKTKFIVLATVDANQTPVLRSLGSFAADELAVYFTTHRSTGKVRQIRENPKVSILFQHENQELASFLNVSLTGDARELDSEEERQKAVLLLGNRNPRFRERAEKGEISENTFFKLDPTEIKVVDFSKGAGAKAVEIINLE